MTATTEPGARFVTLDIVRGVAVMGILAMNIVAFAMPEAAYMNPLAYGTETVADLASWAFSFVLLDGRMRGLFSFLFGASMLLVIERAAASGRSPAAVHYARMGWLLVFGLLHFYFIWFGDILSLYAPVGMIAFAFRHARPKVLIWWAVGLLVVQLLLFAGAAFGFSSAAAAAAAPGASAEAVRNWSSMQQGLGIYTPAQLQEELGLHLGSWFALTQHRLAEDLIDPIGGLMLFGAETLAYMLLGMAAYRSGFITGQWSDASYRRVALIGFGIGIPVYLVLAWLQYSSGFAVPAIFTYGITATVPFRPLMIGATAALVILLTRNGGALVDRVAAAGQAAFTNYLGTSILMTFLFYGWGLGVYGSLSRVQLWIPVVATWALMLLWSKPWLEHFRYGPFEWLWRSLSRGRIEPMRKGPPSRAEVFS